MTMPIGSSGICDLPCAKDDANYDAPKEHTFVCTVNLPRTVTVPSYALLAARLLLESGHRVLLSLTPIALQSSSSTTTHLYGV
jgi:hypothetical protein